MEHSLATEDDDVILFVKDPQRAVKDYLERHGNGGVTRVLGIEKLRKRYGTHEGRRELLHQYDRFLVDARVAPMMQRLLGKSFVEGKHMPLTVDMHHNVTASIERTLHSTAFCPRRGTCCSIVVGRSNFTTEQIVENVHAVLEKVVPRFEGGWKNIQTVNMKTGKSPALPVYIALPDVIVQKTPTKKRKISVQPENVGANQVDIKADEMDVDTPKKEKDEDAKSPEKAEEDCKDNVEKKAEKKLKVKGANRKKTPTKASLQKIVQSENVGADQVDVKADEMDVDADTPKEKKDEDVKSPNKAEEDCKDKVEKKAEKKFKVKGANRKKTPTKAALQNRNAVDSKKKSEAESALHVEKEVGTGQDETKEQENTEIDTANTVDEIKEKSSDKKLLKKSKGKASKTQNVDAKDSKENETSTPEKPVLLSDEKKTKKETSESKNAAASGVRKGRSKNNNKGGTESTNQVPITQSDEGTTIRSVLKEPNKKKTGETRTMRRRSVTFADVENTVEKEDSPKMKKVKSRLEKKTGKGRTLGTKKVKKSSRKV